MRGAEVPCHLLSGFKEPDRTGALRNYICEGARTEEPHMSAAAVVPVTHIIH